MTPESLAHEQWEQLAVGSTLDALEPAEEAALAAHLPTCAQCQRLIDEMTEVTGDLALAAEPVPLPPAVWESISAAIHASDRPPVPAQTRSAAAARPAASARRGSASVPRQRSRPAARFPAAVRWGAALGAAALVIVGVLLGGQLYRDKAASERELASIRDCAGIAQCSVVKLRGPTADAIALVEGPTVRILVKDVPSNDPKTSTYVLWRLAGTSPPQALGTFNVAGSGLRFIPVHAVGPVAGSGKLAVTREPGTKAPARPSVNPLMTGELT